MSVRATLLLDDGSLFEGFSAGYEGISVGEVIFNTSITGYQEILTDPSYAKQLVTLTYPHIGNYGINLDDFEASKVFASGLIVKNISKRSSNFRSTQDLSSFLKQQKLVAIEGVDTRRLTKILREKGSKIGCIMTGKFCEDKCREYIKEFGSMEGKDFTKEVSCNKPYVWQEGTWNLEKSYSKINHSKYHVVAYDFGIKYNILRMLSQRGCKVTIVPAQTSVEQVLSFNPDGIFLSNGPGDPFACKYAIDAIKIFLSKNIPLFGICLGHQLLAIAVGAKTKKMKFGHHGSNHPVLDLDTNKVIITSQNHNFDVDIDSLPSNVRITHTSLFDGTLQGISLIDKNAFAFQGHPEASPGPSDVGYLFDKFIDYLK